MIDSGEKEKEKERVYVNYNCLLIRNGKTKCIM